MINPCPVCDSHDVLKKGSYRANHNCFNGLNRAHCQECGLDFASPMPDERALEAFNNSYFHSAHGGKASDPVAQGFFSGIARLRFAMIEHYLLEHGISVNSLLEWGPGDGYFAGIWLEKHPDTNYLAIETDVSCYPRLKEIGVNILGQEDINSADIKYDLVVMSHVLEHVPEPATFIKRATDKLANGGVIFIEVPCRDWQHKAIDEPHLLFFDKTSMQRLLDKAGFKSIEMRYFGQTIKQLCKKSKLKDIWLAIRSKLISMGYVRMFGRHESGMECIPNIIERAAIKPFKAHCESTEPSWWLRTIARKI